MSIINSYDESEEIIKPIDMAVDKSKLPEIAIVTFMPNLIKEIERDSNFIKCGSIQAGDIMPIYKTTYNKKEVAIYRTLIGGPITVAMMEELIARGVKKIIIFGSCGALVKNIPSGDFILPTESYRDEGTSYHYIPASDFVKVETAEKLSKIFDKNGIKYIKGKTWTTDALYKETVNKANKRKKQGCIVVDMECASIMALAKNRKVEVYQFLYSADTLEDEKWDIRNYLDDETPFLKECLKIALKVADEI